MGGSISVNGVQFSPLVKGGWIFLTYRSEKDWGILSIESPRHFVALSPLTRGVSRTEFPSVAIEIATSLTLLAMTDF